MRILATVFLLTLIGIGSASMALAQPLGDSTNVVVSVITGANGTTDNLHLTLSGTFSGDPYAVTLDQPGDLQPGMSNTYSFTLPYSFCELFQFRLTLDGSDDWLGQQLVISVDGMEVWFDSTYSDGGALTATGWRGGTWDGTALYRSHCPTLPVEVSFVTGANGTVDTPVFDLQGDFSASPYQLILDQPGDFQPGMTNTYDFTVPMSFCQMTNWRIVKGTTGGVDDDWLANEIDISIDGDLIYFDKVFYQLGLITFDSHIGGSWNGTADYQSRCPASGSLPPAVAITPTTDAVGLPGGLMQRTPIPFNPIVLQPLPTNTPQLLLVNPIVLQQLPTNTPEPPLINPAALQPIVPQCEGAPPSRLQIGGQGRVTPGSPNRLRSAPSTSGMVLANIPAGDVFLVMAGPTCGEGYAWWQVNFNGIVGWTVEGSGSTYYLEPA